VVTAIGLLHMANRPRRPKAISGSRMVGTSLMQYLGLAHRSDGGRPSSSGAHRWAIETCWRVERDGWDAGGRKVGTSSVLDKTTPANGMVSACSVWPSEEDGSGDSLMKLTDVRKYPQVLWNVRVARRFDPMAEPKRGEAAAEGRTPIQKDRGCDRAARRGTETRHCCHGRRGAEMPAW